MPGPNNVPPTVREPQVAPPRGLPGAGVGTPPLAADSHAASDDLLRALKLLQAVMSAEDFSKYEKMVLPPSREERTKERGQLLWKKVQSQNRLRKQEAGHAEQIAELEADAAKQRTMLQGVREQVEAVNDEVCALRALVADPTSPSGQPPEPPPLPAPRTPPPPQSQDLLDIVLTHDWDWKTVKMRMTLSGNRYAVLLIGIGVSLGRRMLPCCATCLMRSSWKLFKIVQRVCCSGSCRT